jgi:hypothetical protein
LTHQLLAFSRKQRLAPTPLDLKQLVGEASDMLFRTIGATVRIETVLTKGLWPALVDLADRAGSAEFGDKCVRCDARRRAPDDPHSQCEPG